MGTGNTPAALAAVSVELHVKDGFMPAFQNVLDFPLNDVYYSLGGGGTMLNKVVVMGMLIP